MTVPSSTLPVVTPSRSPVPGFIAVALFTASALMAVLGMRTIGIFIAPVAVLSLLLVVRLSTQGRVDASSPAGAIAGIAVLPAWFAYLAMGHPGVSDEVVVDSGLPSAWLFVAIALGLIGASVGLAAHVRRRASRQSSGS